MYKWKFFSYSFFDSQKKVPTCEFSFYRRPWRILWALPPHYRHLRTKWSRWWNRSLRRMTLTLPNNSQILTQRLPPSGKTRRRRRKMICHEGVYETQTLLSYSSLIKINPHSFKRNGRLNGLISLHCINTPVFFIMKVCTWIRDITVNLQSE